MDSIESQIIKEGLAGRIGGEVFYTPQGKSIKNRIENEIRIRLNGIGAGEIEFPTVVDYDEVKLDTVIKRGRKAQCIQVDLMDNRRRHLIRTCEELAAQYFFSDSGFPETNIIYQIKTKYRDEKTEELCFTKRNEFTMLDVYSYEETGGDKQYETVRDCFIKILEALKVPFEIIPSSEGKDQGILSEEILSTQPLLKGLEIGHIYKLGELYAGPFHSKYKMASYGIGIDRLFAACVLSNR